MPTSTKTPTEQEFEDGGESDAMSVTDSDTPTQSQGSARIDGQPNEAAASIVHGCPVCQTEFKRVQERNRHVETHLPHWILCLFEDCDWTGRRPCDFKKHRKKHPEAGQATVEDPIGLYNPTEFVDMIFEGTPVDEVRQSAFTRAQGSLERLGRRANLWGRKGNLRSRTAGSSVDKSIFS
jgi:hypothetical protein